MQRQLKEDDFIPIPKAAKVLNVSAAKIYRLIHKRVLVGYRFGRNLRIRKKDFETYIENCKED
jgi:excisionase family DNA binding protein